MGAKPVPVDADDEDCGRSVRPGVAQHAPEGNFAAVGRDVRPGVEAGCRRDGQPPEVGVAAAILVGQVDALGSVGSDGREIPVEGDQPSVR